MKNTPLLNTAHKVSSNYVNQLNATKLKSSKAQFQFQFELSLAQLSPSLFIIMFQQKLCKLSKELFG